jgi:hypothetical protein
MKNCKVAQRMSLAPDSMQPADADGGQRGQCWCKDGVKANRRRLSTCLVGARKRWVHGALPYWPGLDWGLDCMYIISTVPIPPRLAVT